MDEHENGISLLILIMGMEEYGIFTELYHYIYIYIFVFCHILSYSMYSRAQGGLYHSVDGQNPAVGNGWSP